jgi:hypothetical protein
MPHADFAFVKAGPAKAILSDGKRRLIGELACAVQEAVFAGSLV